MELLYHYCSTAAFHAIVESHCLWLSSLSLANDTMEGKLVVSTVGRLAERDGLAPSTIRRLQDAIGIFGDLMHGLGFCLSGQGDLLSQWRGYAADATGVAIGFSREYLTWLAETSRNSDEPVFSLEKTEYDLSAHDSRVEPTYREIKKLIDAGVFENKMRSRILDTRTAEEIEHENALFQEKHGQLLLALLPLLPKLFVLKSPSFREEQEWRLLSTLITGGEDICLYRATYDRVVPYRQFQLKGLERVPIAEVVLGPKHITPVKIIEDFMKRNQFGPVQVRRSEASYR